MSALKKISLFLAALPVVGGITVGQVQAQLITPSVDGTATIVTPEGNRFDITGGTLSKNGANLFHSFDQFGFNQNQIANFLSTPSIQNILGRVTGGNASVIDGLIQVSGGNSHLFLMNPAGIILGANARLNVPSDFTATTATGIGLGNHWFNAFGANNYADLVEIPNAFAFNSTQLGSLVNAGQLSVKTGQNLALLGGTVVNTGQLSAPEGRITVEAVPDVRASGKLPIIRLSQLGHVLSLELQPIINTETQGIGTVPQNVSVPTLPQLLTGGNIENATGVTVNSAGQVVLMGSNIQIPSDTGTTIVSGTLDTSGQTGGTVQVLGDKVGLVAANIDASGTNSSGMVLIGGDYQGKGTVPNASRTYVSRDSTITADTQLSGDGGRVIVWADQSTQFFGNISAQGGSTSGNGGFVEVSGKENLTFDGTVDVTAANGDPGSLLLDPENIIIVPDGDPNVDPAIVDTLLADNVILSGEGSGDFYVPASRLSVLFGNVTIAAEQNIRFTIFPGPRDERGVKFLNASSVTITAGGEFNLVRIFNAIRLEQPGAPLTITAGAMNVNVFTNGGDITLTSTSGAVKSNANGQVNSASKMGFGGKITIDSASPTDTLAIDSGLNSSGMLGGGAIKVISRSLINIFEVDSSSEEGNAGKVEITGPTFSTLGAPTFNTSAPKGIGGEIILVANDPNGSIENLEKIDAFGLIRSGDVTLRANEINYKPQFVPAIDPITSLPILDANGNIVEEFANPISANTVRFEPLDVGQNIAVGGSPATNVSGDGTLDLTLGDGTLQNPGDLDGLAFPENKIPGGIIIGREDGTGRIRLPNPVPFNIEGGVLVQGGPGSTLEGPTSVGTTYTIDGASTGTISGFNAPGRSELRFQNIGTLVGGSADDTFRFKDENSIFAGTLDGGGHINGDALDFSTYSSPVLVDLNLSTNTAVNQATGQSIITGASLNIESAIGGSGNDTLIGNASNNTLIGNAGNDTLIGNDGDDLLSGGLGIDNFNGGNGTDRILEIRDADITLTDTSLTIGAEGIDQLTGIEAATLIGGASANKFNVFNWNGTADLNGVEAGDTYTFNIGTGTGTINLSDSGTTGIDDLTFNGTAGNDQLSLDQLAPTTSQLRLLNGETINFSGTETLAVNTLAGDDTLNVNSWSSSNTTLNGGEGNDTFTVSNLTSTITLEGGEGSDGYTVNFNGAGVGTTNVKDLGTAGVDSLAVNGTAADDQLIVTATQVIRSGEIVNYGGIEGNLSVDAGLGNDTVSVETPITLPTGNVFLSAGKDGGNVIVNNAITANSINLNGTTTNTISGSLNSGGGGINLTGDSATLNGSVVATGGGAVKVITVNDITTTANVTADSGINFTSIDGSIDTRSGTLSANTGAVNASAEEEITTGNITGNSGISLASTESRVDTTSGTLNSSNGGVSVSAEDKIITGNVIGNSGINLASGGQIDTRPGELNSGSSVVNASAEEEITTGNITGNSGISLASTESRVDTTSGILNSSNGGVSVSAEDKIITGNVIGNRGINLASDGQIDTRPGELNSEGGTVIATARGNITTAEVTANNGITLNSRNGSINAAVVNPNRGGVSATAEEDITTGNITAPGGVSLVSRRGNINSGNLTSSETTSGGSITVSARNGSITAGVIDSSSSAGNGGAITLSAEDDIQVSSMNSQGSPASSGGNVNITTDRFFRASSTFTDQNGLNASISSAGGTGGGDVTIQHGGNGIIPFEVGNVTTNGTAGAITTGSGNTILPILSFPGEYTQGNIRIVTKTGSSPSSLPLSALNPEVLSRTPSAQLPPTRNLPSAEINIEGWKCALPDSLNSSPRKQEANSKSNQGWVNYLFCLHYSRLIDQDSKLDNGTGIKALTERH